MKTTKKHNKDFKEVKIYQFEHTDFTTPIIPQKPKMRRENLRKFLFISLPFLTPLCINILFSFPAFTPILESHISAGELLGFEGAIIAALILYETVRITIQNNHKAQLLTIIDSKIESFLRELEHKNIEKCVGISDPNGRSLYIYKVIDSIKEQYNELTLYLPYEYLNIFQSNLKCHLDDIERKLTEYIEIACVYSVDKTDFLLSYEGNTIIEVSEYFDKTYSLAKNILYKIRHNLINE